MQELTVNENDAGQRLDRFMLKYLSEAPRNFVFRMIRQKNIELNRKKAEPDEIIKKGDKIQMFLADDTIAKFKGEVIIEDSNLKIDVIYEDENIILMNKPVGVLSHEAEDNKAENMVDGMINYLIDKGDYNPKKEHNFIPSICNRLDRNTSGLIIGAKTYEALRDMNETIRKGGVERYYHTIVKGDIDEAILLSDYLVKDGDRNIVKIVDESSEGAKKIDTNIVPVKVEDGYSLLEVELLTGRTHQIRIHMESIGTPIIGDRKYGNRETNKYFKDKYNLNSQYLHAYRIKFRNPVKGLNYLRGKEFIANATGDLGKIEKALF